jgi:hypothetical protein
VFATQPDLENSKVSENYIQPFLNLNDDPKILLGFTTESPRASASPSRAVRGNEDFSIRRSFNVKMLSAKSETESSLSDETESDEENM